MRNGWREAGSILRAHRSGVMCDPHCCLVLSVRYKEVLILVCTGRNHSNYDETVRRHVEFVHPDLS